MVVLHGILVSSFLYAAVLDCIPELTCSLAKNNHTELFEDNQRDLERAVENLGYLLESNFGDANSTLR